jgi:hypothetical protein
MSCERARKLGIFDLSHRRSEDLQRMQDEQIKTDVKEREALQLKYGKQLDKLNSVAEDERY